MDSPSPLEAYFAEAQEKGLVVVNEMPKFELESYIANYTGRTRFERLYFIGCTSSVLCVEALKLAIAEAKEGLDVSRYRDAVKTLARVAPDETEATEDAEWVSQTTHKASETTSRLSEDLKTYRRNLVGESIRLGYADLGKHYENIGKLNLALEHYRQIQREGLTPLHLLDMYGMIVRVAFQTKDWGMALNSLNKMQDQASCIEGDDTERDSAIHVCQGLAHMKKGEWRDACNSFLAVASAPNSTPYNEFASPNDIAVFGSLLALATMERSDLQTKVLGSAQFRTLLAIEPMLRKAIAAYVSGRYSSCLSILELNRSDYLLDIYLNSHVNELYQQIRSKCIREYCKPFSTVTIHHLEGVFQPVNKSMIGEVRDLIESGQLQAHINTIDGIITSRPKPTSLDVLYRTVSRVTDFEDCLRSSLRQMGLVLSGLDNSTVEKTPRSFTANGSASASIATGSVSGAGAGAGAGVDADSAGDAATEGLTAQAEGSGLATVATQSVSSGNDDTDDVDMTD